MSSDAQEDRRQVGDSVYSGFKWLGLAMGANQLVRLLATVVLARLLELEDFGLVTLATTAVFALSTFREIGFGQALVQRPVKDPAELRRAASTAFWIVQATNLAIFAAGWALAPTIAGFFERVEGVAPVLRALLVGFLVEGIAVVSAALLQKELRFQALARNEMRATLCYGAVAIGCALAGMGVWSLVAGQLVSRAWQVGGLLRLSGWRPTRELSPEIARELFRFGRWLWANAILQVVHRSADKLLLGKLAGGATLGAYGIAYSLCTAPAQPASNLLVRVAFPTLSRMQGDRGFVARSYASGLALLSFATLPAAIGLVLVAPDFVATVYGSRWGEELAPLIRILTLFGASVMIGALTRPVLLALGRTRALTLIGSARQLCMLALLPLLAPAGAPGVAWAMTLPTLASLGVSHLVAVRACGGSQAAALRPQVGIVASTGAMALGLLLLAGPIAALPWAPLRLLVACAIGAALYLAAARLAAPALLAEAWRRGRRVLRARGDLAQRALDPPAAVRGAAGTGAARVASGSRSER